MARHSRNCGDTGAGAGVAVWDGATDGAGWVSRTETASMSMPIAFMK